VSTLQANVARLWWLWLEQYQGKDLQKHNNKGKPDPVNTGSRCKATREKCPKVAIKEWWKKASSNLRLVLASLIP
jgi:hypothetical protein